MDSHPNIITTLLAIINFLSIILIGAIGYFLKELWSDIKVLKREFTILQTEHALTKERCHEYHDQHRPSM